jgi:hypothetical protein
MQNPRKPYGRMRTLVSDLRRRFDDLAIDSMVGLLAAQVNISNCSSTCMPDRTAACLVHNYNANDPRLPLLVVGAAISAAVEGGPGRRAAVLQGARRRGSGGATPAATGLQNDAVRCCAACLVPGANVATTFDISLKDVLPCIDA